MAKLELDGWKQFGAKLDVPFTGQKILSSRWVVVEKTNPDGTRKIKARLVIRGCETPLEDRPRSDSPCAGRVSLKITIAIGDARNLVENFHSVRQAKDHRLCVDIVQLQEHVRKGLKLVHAPACSQLADSLYKRTASSALLLECLNTSKLPDQCRKIVLDEVKK